jgi:hypothetical protein
MSWLYAFIAQVLAKFFVAWRAEKLAEGKGAAEAEVEGLRRAEAQEQEAKKIDSAPPPKDQSDDAFLTKYRRD